MANFLRLSLFSVLVIFSAVASAFTANPQYSVTAPYVSSSTLFDSASAACSAVVASLQSRAPANLGGSYAINSVTETACNVVLNYDNGGKSYYTYSIAKVPGACPPFSTGTSPNCQCVPPTVLGGDGLCKVPACPVGQHEEGGSCVPDACKPNETRVNGVCIPEPPCPAGQSRVNGKCVPFKCPTQGVESDQWYDLEGPGSAATCLYNHIDNTYCTLTIKPQFIGMSGGKPTYYGGYGVYTGGTCGPSEPGKPTPVDPDNPNGDPDRGTKPPAPGDPKPGDKPGGSPGGPGNTPTPPGPDGKCPDGTYKSNGGCYSKDPPKQPPDNDGKCPSGYIKVNSECIPLMPRPDDAKEKDPNSFGGQCESVQCDGDAIQCAMAREQYRRNCQMLDADNDPSTAFNQAKAGTDGFSMDKLRSEAQQVSVSTFDSAGFGWSHTCPPDPEFTLEFAAGRSFVIPFSRVCGVLGLLSLAGVGITLLGSLVWVLGGKNNRG
ncbi:hypothetical protein CLU85_2730 [Acidovorax sp. 69]|uniref:hypothetical protein n=1 Tax=Acidovorax sp. 69 TaxID=2035202 RepID=UPI000CB17179|nr:hypothetical protein [Acidovorax sp. 69]PJI97930.1 hypothetical protein CLU85_2730 [Acidovorax sp. 69]